MTRKSIADFFFFFKPLVCHSHYEGITPINIFASVKSVFVLRLIHIEDIWNTENFQQLNVVIVEICDTAGFKTHISQLWYRFQCKIQLNVLKGNDNSYNDIQYYWNKGAITPLSSLWPCKIKVYISLDVYSGVKYVMSIEPLKVVQLSRI